MKDPRHRNVQMDVSSMYAFQKDYAEKLRGAIAKVDSASIEKAANSIVDCANKGNRVYVAGNGGSAAIAEHLCCDWTKGTQCAGHQTIRAHSLTSNVALYSAIANDFSFDKVFSTQIEMFAGEGDILIAISSSGNSQNIEEAALAAKRKGMLVIGFSGFQGGKLASMADISLHTAIDNYGVVEDSHQALMHIIGQYIAYKRDNENHA